MANDYDTRGRNKGADGIAAAVTRLALHTGDPGGADSASNEVTGGSPAYARKACTWNAAASGAAALNANVVFDIPPSTTVSWITGWNTAGTERYFKKDVADEAFSAQGTYTVLASGTSLDLNDA